MLTKNTQLQKAELHRKRTLSTSLLIMCGLLGTLAGAIYLNFKRKNQLLKQSEQLKTQQVREMQKQQQLLAMQSVLKGQEEERSRLAKDLHDGVGGLLSGVKLSLSTMKGNVILSEKNAQMLNNVVVQLDQSMNELRRVSHNMMPESLIKFGLVESLLIYCDSLNETGLIKVQLQTYGMEERMEQNTEIVLYRIIQELLNNVVKHAEAKNVLVQLVRKNNRFNLTVEDDGKGFDLNGIAKNGGAGLNNIRARAEYLGATVDIQSAPAEGTSVNIEGGCA
jgi:signal transduction histidine kinase